MLLLPAIHLKDGKCVRLKQGAMDKATVFSDDPAAMAERWLKLGARRLHVVDLNGAAAGRPKNESAIKAIAAAVGDKLPIQLGGGSRDLDTVEKLRASGARARALTVPVIASGGITSLEDIKSLCKFEHEGITGAITGRAIYEGKLDFAAAQKLADGPGQKE